MFSSGMRGKSSTASVPMAGASSYLLSFYETAESSALPPGRCEAGRTSLVSSTTWLISLCWIPYSPGAKIA